MVAGGGGAPRGEFSRFFTFSGPTVTPGVFTGGMHIVHELLGLALLAAGVLVAAGAGLGALVGLGRLERRLVPAPVEVRTRPGRPASGTGRRPPGL